jgi:hypothetical protein
MQEITQERWITWAKRLFARRDIEITFLDQETRTETRVNINGEMRDEEVMHYDEREYELAAKQSDGNVRISISADHTYEYLTLYFDFNDPPIF